MRRSFALLLPLALVLAACGGGSDSGSSKDSQGSSSESGSESGNEIEQLIKKGNDARVKVTYKTGDGTTLTIVQDPPKRALLQGDTAVYEDGSDGAVICTNVGKPDVSCIRAEGLAGISNFAGGGSLGVVAQILQQENLPGVTRIDDREIAGRKAVCAKYSVPIVGNAAVESCVDKETGVALLLRTSTSAGTNLDLEATKVEEPKASDFVPPATPQDLSEFIPSIPTT